VLIRGNMRADRLTVFQSVCEKVQELFGSKYSVLMIEDPEALGEDEPAPVRPSKAGADGSSAAAAPEPRVAFQVRKAAGSLACWTVDSRNVRAC
jgi:hypothetical protein